ncbi:hypothetical protein ACROYT_G029450 [Oculina patagonica]
MASGSSDVKQESSLRFLFSGEKTRKEVEREKHKPELGVCRIRKLLKDGEGYQTLGSGSVIKNLMNQWPWKDRCCVVTSDKVFPEEDFDINDIYLDFWRLRSSTPKTVKLGTIAKSDAIHRFTSGLVVIPLKTPKPTLGAIPGKTSSIIKYRPFTKGNEISNELFCPIVDDTVSSGFDVKSFRLKQILDLQFVLHDGQSSFKTLAEFTGSSNLKPHGAVILSRGENLNAVGVLSCRDDGSSIISPVWLSQENMSSLSLSGHQYMASAPPLVASTKETTNYAQLCRLLVDVGSQALRDTFDGIHPPAGLHLVLALHPARAMLQTLRQKKILNPTQWRKLYPTIPFTVSSASFDITLLMVLLRNICGLHAPVTGWDSLPPPADTSEEANIARVKYYRNTVYGHASQASVDDVTFNTYWQDISNALVALGGTSYGAAINGLKNECMDPDTEEHYRELLKQWKKDEDNIKDKLDEIEDKIRNEFGQMKSEIGSLIDKFDIWMVQREKTKDDELAMELEQMEDKTKKIKEESGQLSPVKKIPRMEVGTLSSIVRATMEFEAGHEECLRVCPYIKDGEVVVHFYVYSGTLRIPAALITAAEELFGEMGVKLEWSDLYNNADDVLNVTPIEYPSGEPNRLEASQVDEIDKIINKNLHVFSKHRNITAVQPSFKVTKSVQTKEACVAVYVLGKGNIPIGESTIPSTIGSYPVDIVNGFFLRTVAPEKPNEAQEPMEVLCLGASIAGNKKKYSGTLGAIVKDENTGTLYALSCDHVMRHDDTNDIIHPGSDHYLNYLHYYLFEYRNTICGIDYRYQESLQIPEDSSQFKEFFTKLETIKEEIIKEKDRDVIEERLKKIQKCKEKLEKGFSLPPRIIAKYSAGIRKNVASDRYSKDFFLDVAVSELKENEEEKLKRSEAIQIIGTAFFPSGECIPATRNDLLAADEFFKSGSGTGYTQANRLYGANSEPPLTIKDKKVFRKPDGTPLLDVRCINCQKKISATEASSQAQESRPSPCEICEPDTWLKSCLCFRAGGFKQFSDKGDSGAVIFVRESYDQISCPAVGIIFGKFPNQISTYSLASPLEIALEELSKEVSKLRPPNSPCKLTLASKFN